MTCRKDLFASLDLVDWASLYHAYGSSADIPDHFRQLLSEDEEIRQSVLDNFYMNIFHQGTVYPAVFGKLNCSQRGNRKCRHLSSEGLSVPPSNLELGWTGLG